MHLPRQISRLRLLRIVSLSVLLIGLLDGSAIYGQTPRKRTSPSPTPKPKASASPSASPTATPAYIVPDVVAAVDGKPIQKKQIEGVVVAVLASQGRTLDNVSVDDKRSVYRSVLEDKIVTQLLADQAVSEVVPDADVETQFAAFRKQYPDQNAFDAELARSGQTADQVRQTIRAQLAGQQWVEHQIADQIKTTPQEIEQFYNQGPTGTFDAPEIVHASHILVRVARDAPPEDMLDAEKKINDLVARLKKGEAFDALAKQFSDDPKAKANGGDLGFFTRGKTMPEFEAVAFRLKAGQVSDPVRTEMGFHLIKVVEHQPARTATLNEARDQINEFLVATKRREAVTKLVQGLKEKAAIEIFLP